MWIALAFAGVALGWLLVTRPKPPGSIPVSIPDKAVEIAGLPTEGRPDAPVVLIEFSDFECPYCGVFARDTYPTIRDEYVGAGSVRMVFWDLPLEQRHPLALNAAATARCAGGDEGFWQAHDEFFADQRNLAATVNRYAAGSPAIATCAAGSIAGIQAEARRAIALGVFSTPTFFVGYPRDADSVTVVSAVGGAWPIGYYRRTLDRAIREAKTH